MPINFDSIYGWREVRSNTAITAGAPVQVLAAPGLGNAILVRRIRGSSTADLRILSATTQLGSVIKANDYIDVPGLELWCAENAALQLDVTAGTAIVNDVSIQYAIVAVRDSRMAV